MVALCLMPLAAMKKKKQIRQKLSLDGNYFSYTRKDLIDWANVSATIRGADSEDFRSCRKFTKTDLEVYNAALEVYKVLCVKKNLTDEEYNKESKFIEGIRHLERADIDEILDCMFVDTESVKELYALHDKYGIKSASNTAMEDEENNL